MAEGLQARSRILFAIIYCVISSSAYAERMGLSAIPARPNLCPEAKYSDELRIYQGAPSIERAPNGRLWAAWYGDCALCGDNLHNFVMMATSKDDGKTWSPIKIVLDPDGCGPVRASDPYLWHDPQGRLWLFWAQEDKNGRNTIAMSTENPSDENPAWSMPRRICDNMICGRPTAISDGTWLIATRTWRGENSCNVIASRDKGESWGLLGSPVIPDKNDREKNEAMIVERKDGSLWMLVRTSYGIGESISKDVGNTWSELKPSNIPNAQSRFFISRLKSGKLLLLRQNNPKAPASNSHLSAFLSDDDGATWSKGLPIDERGSACYPDAIEGLDGIILVIYEMGRWSDKEILMTAFNEQDISNSVSDVHRDKLMLVNKGKAKPPTAPGLSSIPVLPDFNPKPEYADNLRMHQGIPSIERAPTNGRLWATWYGGGSFEDMHSYVMLATSGDDGKTWSPIKLVIDPDGCGPLRAFDPCLWHDPQGRMWLFWAQKDAFGMNNIAMFTENSGDENPVWSKPRHIGAGVMINKPTVLRNGDWLLPACVWRDDRSSRIYCSRDKGKSFDLLGTTTIPRKEDRTGEEGMIIERKDGSLWMLARTTYGMGESFSKDGGKTWTDIAKCSIPHAQARFFIRRLKSGMILLVRHNAPDIAQRSHLSAFLSEDDGHTWSKGLMIDERGGVSYPDGVEGPDGQIHLIYDYMRTNNGQILMAVFSEKDVGKGDFSPEARQRIIVNQAGGENPLHRKVK